MIYLNCRDRALAHMAVLHRPDPTIHQFTIARAAPITAAGNTSFHASLEPQWNPNRIPD
jgi:hypothetical protein